MKILFKYVHLQVCDNALRIRYINARYPGATHDATVFNMSSLKHRLEDDYRRGERNLLLGLLLSNILDISMALKQVCI